jgi:purine-binding chemotaxis protein CheW
MEQVGKVGFIVDCVKEVVSISEEQVENMKYDSMDDTTHFVSAVGKEADSIISLLDLNAVVLDKNFKEENA